VKTILSGQSKISLRLIDWLVTNYAKKHNISFVTKTGRHVIVYLAYKAHLKAYSKKMFDPFCRWKRIQFMELNTTVGQLSFFEWAIQDEILDYLETFKRIWTSVQPPFKQPRDDANVMSCLVPQPRRSVVTMSAFQFHLRKLTIQ
jgi:hypothetical protein